MTTTETTVIRLARELTEDAEALADDLVELAAGEGEVAEQADDVRRTARFCAEQLAMMTKRIEAKSRLAYAVIEDADDDG